MMRKMFSVALMMTLACALGLAQNAKAGVTFDIVFQDATGPSGLTIQPGDAAAPGCAFGGFAGGSVATGRCMDVILTTTDTLIGLGVSVTYDQDNALALAGMYEWIGVGVVFNMLGVPTKFCTPPGGLADNPLGTGGTIQSFDCIVPPPNLTTTMVAGTYRIGTIIWDTSGTTVGTETIAAYIDGLVDGAIAIINGNVVDVSASIVVGSHILTIIPEPGTVSLLGLGLVGLILAGRRSR
jgi:hypothetical protein